MPITDACGFVECCRNHESEEHERRRDVIMWKIALFVLAYMALVVIIVNIFHYIFVSHDSRQIGGKS
jgi:hypothetical protein